MYRPSLVTACLPHSLLLCAVVISGCVKNPPPGISAKPLSTDLGVMTATVVSVTAGKWPDVVRTQGSLVADEVVIVGAKVPGRVAEVSVDLGDEVGPQAQLVVLDQADFRLQVTQAEAELAQARAALGLQPGEPVSKLDPENAPPVLEQKAIWDEAQARSERIRQLSRQNAVTDADVEQAIAAERVAAARYASAVNAVNEKIALIGVRTAELSLANERLKDAVIVAPFAALVQQRHVAPGSYVQVGQPVVSLVRTNPLRFQGTIPERYAHQLQIGREVRLRVRSVPGERVVAVTRISPALDELSRSLMFEAVVENSDSALRSGLFAEGEIVLNPEAESIVVPASSVVEFAGTEKIWKVVDGVAREQVVLTGKRRGDRVEILEGLSIGDTVLVEGESGTVVRIEPVLQPSPDPQSPSAIPVIGGQGEIQNAELPAAPAANLTTEEEVATGS